MARCRRAFRQGDLDGLCGVYSVVNAVRTVEGLNKSQSRATFRRLVRVLGQGSRPYEPLLWGMGFRRLKHLVATTRRCRLPDRELAFRARPLRLTGKERTLSGLWAALERELGPTCVALVGITGVTDHWCVVYRVTPKTLWLLDSAGLTRIRRSRCTVRSSRVHYSLVLGQILLIER